MWKLSDYLSRLQKCANFSISEGGPSWIFGGGPNHLDTALVQIILGGKLKILRALEKKFVPPFGAYFLKLY